MPTDDYCKAQTQGNAQNLDAENYFTRYILQCMDSGDLPATCPQCKVDNVETVVELSLVQQQVSAEQFARYEELLIDKAGQALDTVPGNRWVRCNNPNGCNSRYVLEDDCNGRFTCTTCGFVQCANCHVAYHTGVSCEEFQRWRSENE